jgi:hypothetical protein
MTGITDKRSDNKNVIPLSSRLSKRISIRKIDKKMPWAFRLIYSESNSQLISEAEQFYYWAYHMYGILQMQQLELKLRRCMQVGAVAAMYF